MNSQSVTVKLTQDSSDLLGNFHMNQKKNAFLYLTWAVLVLCVMILPTISYASDGNDLMKAARNGNLSTVRTLLAKGAKIDYQDKVGTTVLMRASGNGHLEIVRLLLAKGARTDLRGSSGGTALIWASQQGHVKIVQDLLAKGVKINRQNISGDTALIVASKKGHLQIVQALLAQGTNINHQNKYGGTALSYAKKQEIKKLLKAYGATESVRSDSIDLGGVLIVGSFLGVLFYPILQFLAIRRTAGVWRIFAYLPLIPMIFIIAITIIGFYQESNLWPMILILAMPAIIVYLVVFIILKFIRAKKNSALH
jgi:hypothetical protein